MTARCGTLALSCLSFAIFEVRAVPFSGGFEAKLSRRACLKANYYFKNNFSVRCTSLPDGTMSVPWKRWLNSSAHCENASSPNSLFLTQQKANRNRLCHSFATFLYMNSFMVFPLSSSLSVRYFFAPFSGERRTRLLARQLDKQLIIDLPSGSYAMKIAAIVSQKKIQ